MSERPLYDTIGTGYTTTRREDPRIARRIHAALGDSGTVVNVGAGTGSYEPRDRDVTAVEPSPLMISQRPPGSAPVVQATAEALPFPDNSCDAAMAVLTDHHWQDRERGLRELRRVARERVVVLTWDRSYANAFWLTRDYLPKVVKEYGVSLEQKADWVGATHIEVVPVPHDCRDGFFHAFWRRPEAYLDPAVRAGTSPFRTRPAEEVEAALGRLREDLESGRWRERNSELLELEELDLGY